MLVDSVCLLCNPSSPYFVFVSHVFLYIDLVCVQIRFGMQLCLGCVGCFLVYGGCFLVGGSEYVVVFGVSCLMFWCSLVLFRVRV